VLLSLPSVAGAAYLGLHRRYYASGLRVAIATPTIKITSALERLEQAFAFIATIDPSARKRIDSYVRHIVVWPGSYSAANKWGGIHLSAEYLMIAREARLAATLVHETVHLRVTRLGVPYASSLRERIERLCIREEAAFLRKIPEGGEEFAKEVEEELQSQWWTDESHDKALDEAVEKGDLRRWAARLVRRR
jgi:hypothetical protein